MRAVTEVEITNISSQGIRDPLVESKTNDLLAVEAPLEISIIHGEGLSREKKNISITMCTPGHEAELAMGFLFTEGIIRKADDIVNIYPAPEFTNENTITVELRPGIVFDPAKLERHFYTSSSCGVCGKSSISAVKNVITKDECTDQISIAPSLLLTLPDTLRKQQEVFGQTGGLHASALFDLLGNLVLTREDVGRHNALDKLIGAALEKEWVPLDQHILLLSGRASFELIQKAAMAGIRVVCAVGAPSSLAVEMANDCGMTLVGFLREKRFNIYCGNRRINTH